MLHTVFEADRAAGLLASAGVDHSNTADEGEVILLPLDPDESARGIRAAIAAATGAEVSVIVTDSFGRPFRAGTTDVARPCVPRE